MEGVEAGLVVLVATSIIYWSITHFKNIPTFRHDPHNHREQNGPDHFQSIGRPWVLQEVASLRLKISNDTMCRLEILPRF